jgi:hypothetical protein
VPPLAAPTWPSCAKPAALNWSAIDVSIFGTLFERGLDPAKRSQLGAHYTDPATIMRLVEPVVQRPLLAEWALVAQQQALAPASAKKGDKAWRDAQAAFVGFLERLQAYRVLDPACGSGNFLYLALKCLKDIEHQATWRPRTGPGPPARRDRPAQRAGHRAERIRRRAGARDGVDRRAAVAHPARLRLQDQPGAGHRWTTSNAAMRCWRRTAPRPPGRGGCGGGESAVFGRQEDARRTGRCLHRALRAAYEGRVPGGADLVCYWFEKARRMIEAGHCSAPGWSATNSIRGGANRKVLDRIVRDTRIFDGLER